MTDSTLPLAETTDETSIHEEFFICYKLYNKICENIGSEDSEFKKCIELCHVLIKKVRKLNIVSANEEVEDINTEMLKFGLLTHIISELYTNRSSGTRTKLLRISNIYAKQFLNTCENERILEMQEQKIFDNGFEDMYDKRVDPFKKRTEHIRNEKQLQVLHQEIQLLLKKCSANKSGAGVENNWQLFTEEEDERNFWLNQFQICIRLSLKTLKQNAFEQPLSERWELEQKNISTNISNNNEFEKDGRFISNQKSMKYQWNQRTNEENDGKTKDLKVWNVNASGEVTKFKNFAHMKEYTMNERRIDTIVQMKTDRNLIIRDSNPWTYTVEEAAQLGLLPEIPKDYEQKRKAKQLAEYRNRQHIQRYGMPNNFNNEDDDGSELNPGQVEYHRKGKVTYFTMHDLPKEKEENVDDLNDEEYDIKRKDQMHWDGWKDEHEKGAGNPYYRT